MTELDEEEQFTAETPPVEEVPLVESAPVPESVTVPESAPAPEPEISQPVEQTYTVLEGEKLGDIAKKLNLAGGWPALFHKNRDVVGDNPNKVAAGTTLVLP